MMRAETKIRAALRSKKHSDGLTRAELVQVTKLDASEVSQGIKRIPEAYIDRWEQRTTSAGHPFWAAVFCLADVPANAPRPKKKPASASEDARRAERWRPGSPDPTHTGHVAHYGALDHQISANLPGAPAYSRQAEDDR